MGAHLPAHPRWTTRGPEVLHSFTGGADGAYPYAGLIEDAAGNLYGTTRDGGASDDGTVFKLTAKGIETVLHNFSGRGDGEQPYGRFGT